MMKVNTKRPQWYKDPEELDSKLIIDPLEQVYCSIKLNLEKETGEPQNFYLFVKSLLQIAYQTYSAIRKLVARNSRYPFQAHILVRSLIDNFFTIAVLMEDPEGNSMRYEKAGYRQQWETFKREKERYGSDADWTNWINERDKFFDGLSQILNLTEEEKNDPASIDYWPTPPQLLKGKGNSSIALSSEKKVFLKEIKDWHYGEFSEASHSSWGGMAMSVFVNSPETHWTPGKFESDCVYYGILFLLMILSEIESFCHYSQNQKLCFIWTVLGASMKETKDYYDLRYSKILKNK